MATSTNSSGLVSGFITDLRSQYQNATPSGGTAVNWNNVTKDTFNNGVIGVGYGLAETVISQPVAPHTSVFTGAKIDFSASNMQAAKVIRGLGQALGCTMDVAEAVGNASQGRCA